MPGLPGAYEVTERGSSKICNEKKIILLTPNDIIFMGKESIKPSDDQNRVVYNVTTQVDRSIAPQWLLWMKESHIPDIIATGCFTKANILQLVEVGETSGPTYAIQYYADSMIYYNTFIEKFSELMRKKENDHWAEGFISFRSVLLIVN